MYRILKASLVLLSCLVFIQCQKADEMDPIPVIPYADQYPVDIAAIEKFMDENYMEVDANQNVSFFKIPSPNPDNKISIADQTEYPVQHKMVNSNGVDYKVYFINISKKTSSPYDPDYYGENLNPTRVDKVFVTYKGTLMDNTTFDQANNPVWLPMDNVVQGWAEIIPKFKSGNLTSVNPDGTFSFNDYGAGIMFLPSGLGYYNISQGSIPGYAPLIFNFKLMQLEYVDHDGDGILSKDEDLNGNGIFTDDDTDGDGRQNYKDKDDDGDGVLTKTETKRPKILVNGEWVDNGNYPYNGASVDDPSTTEIDETQGIPSCSGDFTASTRLRKHLDKNCQ